jgi:hypothetical protein
MFCFFFFKQLTNNATLESNKVNLEGSTIVELVVRLLLGPNVRHRNLAQERNILF